MCAGLGRTLDRDPDPGAAAAARRGAAAQEPAGHLCRWPGLEPRTRCQPRRRETMNRTILSPVLCVALAACASTRPASEIALDAPVEIEATPIAHPPAPRRVRTEGRGGGREC